MDSFVQLRAVNKATCFECFEPQKVISRKFWETDGAEKAHYADIVSLYSFVNKWGKYIKGDPDIKVSHDSPPIDNNFDGFASCKVLPPTSLFHPVLPARFHKKLLFVLCHREKKHDTECDHTDKERALTWAAPELHLALEKGYKIQEVYETWQYPTTQYDPSTKDGGLFASYVNMYLKMKVEASGFPGWCDTEEKKSRVYTAI